MAIALIQTGDVTKILHTVDASRRETGEKWANGPGQALAVLELLANRSDDTVLVDAVRALNADGRGHDAELLLETAALDRPAEEVAALVVALIRAGQEGAGSRLTEEFALRRGAQDLARFTRALHLVEEGDRARDFLRTVASRRGTRDTARVCLALHAYGRGPDADEVLDDLLAAPRSAADLGVLTSVVGCRVLEDWILTVPARIARERENIQRSYAERQETEAGLLERAKLLTIGFVQEHRHRPSPEVIRSAAAHWPVPHLRDLLVVLRGGDCDEHADRLVDAFAETSAAVRPRSCEEILELLALLEKESPQDFVRLRDRLAHRPDIDGLVSLIIEWADRGEPLLQRLPEFLAVVACGSADPGAPGPAPRSLADLEGIVRGLDRYDNKKARTCTEQLATEAARSVRHRSGGDAARLLSLFPERRARGRNPGAALLAGGLVDGLIKHEVPLEEVVRYLREVTDQRRYHAVDAFRDVTVGTLADPALLVRLAVALWNAGIDRGRMELLSRWLERDRLVSPHAVRVVFLGLCAGGVPEDRRLELLRETVGRWPQNRREEAAAELRAEPSLGAEADLLDD